MALIACHECGAKISDNAQRCPHCGVSGKKAKTYASWTMVFLLIMFICWMLSAVMNS
jgi:RNA polymerase subunit RPABC4/transcription elongation factor Spt4